VAGADAREPVVLEGSAHAPTATEEQPVTAVPTDGASKAPKHSAEPTLGALVAEASASMSAIVRGEVELAKLELKSSVKNGGVGIGLFAAAAVLLVFSLTFGLIALAEGLIAIGLYRWLGYLVVFGLLLVIIALLVFVGIKKVKRVRAPRQTIDSSRDTVAYLKSHPKSVPPASST
jgi:uncharacterized membrane protein YqjE